jgi:two-component system nitrogen regulation sensor histidine kinase GlnL
VLGSRDLLIQAFLNLVKNATEAIGDEAIDGEITLSTAYRHGVRLKTGAGAEPVSLPLEICVRDNGPGVPSDIAGDLFDPFVTSKSSGSGLGLALVAKVIGDHGGIVEFESRPRRTTFRVLMPLDPRRPAAAPGAEAGGGAELRDDAAPGPGAPSPAATGRPR